MMRRAMIRLVFLLLAVAATDAQEVFISGNGRLTVAVDAQGGLRYCSWPSPGYYSQLPYVAGAAAEGGASWFLQTGEGCHDPYDGRLDGAGGYAFEDASILRHCFAASERGGRIEQRLLVAAELDVLAVQVRVEAGAARPRLFWRQDFAPKGVLRPAFLAAVGSSYAQDDFVLFQDAGKRRAYHVRPASAGSAAWAIAEEAVAQGAFGALEALDEAVWIGCASPNPLAGFQCDTPEAVARQVRACKLEGRGAVAGANSLAWALAPEKETSAYCFTVYVAFGQTRGAVDQLLGKALEKGFKALEEATRSHWRDFLRPAACASEHMALEAVRKRSLLTLAQSMDIASGAVIASPSMQFPGAVALPEEVAWLTAAWTRAGYSGLARKHLAFYGSRIQRQAHGLTPLGSLARCYYANGDAAPLFPAPDMRLPARLLLAFWALGEAIGPDEAKAYYAAQREAIRLAADGVANWRDARQGAPLPSYDARYCCARQTQANTLVALLGLRCAQRIYAVLGKPFPTPWTLAEEDFETLIRFQLLDNASPWRIDACEVYWLKRLFKAEEPLWKLWVQDGEGEEALRLGELAFPVTRLLEAPEVYTEYSPSARAALRFLAASAAIYARAER